MFAFAMFFPLYGKYVSARWPQHYGIAVPPRYVYGEDLWGNRSVWHVTFKLLKPSFVSFTQFVLQLVLATRCH